MVLVLVDSTVEMLVACKTEVDPLATLVVVIGQLVTVVYTTSLTTLATVDFAVTELLAVELEVEMGDTATADDVGVISIVVADLVDVRTTFDVMGVLRAGQSTTLEAQAVMTISLVLKTVVAGITVEVDLILDETVEMVVLWVELTVELELAVLLMALMLL